MTEPDVDVLEVLDLVDQIKPLLDGHELAQQGAVLADLLAICLAGHVVVGDPKATDKLRQRLLFLHCEGVRGLVQLIKPELERKIN